MFSLGRVAARWLLIRKPNDESGATAEAATEAETTTIAAAAAAAAGVAAGAEEEEGAAAPLRGLPGTLTSTSPPTRGACSTMATFDEKVAVGRERERRREGGREREKREKRETSFCFVFFS